MCYILKLLLGEKKSLWYIICIVTKSESEKISKSPRGVPLWGEKRHRFSSDSFSSSLTLDETELLTCQKCSLASIPVSLSRSTEKNTRFLFSPPKLIGSRQTAWLWTPLQVGSGFLAVKLPLLVRTLAELNAVKVVWKHVPCSSRHFAPPCKALMRVACVTRLAPVQEGGPSLHPSLALIASFNIAECLHLPPMPLCYLLFLRVLLYLHYALCLLVCH